MKHTMKVLFAFAVVLVAARSLPAQAMLSGSYKVGPQDVLQITVYDETGMTNKYRVDSDGTINFPLLNRVAVAGLTPTEIENKLKEELISKDLFKTPQINVDVLEFRSRRVWVIGAVKQPNEYRLVGDMNLIAALAQAGGPAENASNEVHIMRPKPGQPQAPVSLDKSQDAAITVVSMKELLGGDAGMNVSLQDGDTIYLPAAERFYVSGYVQKVGPYVHERGLTVQQALVLAGGVTELGSDKRVSIERMEGTKKKVLKNVKPTELVLPGDTIKVERRRF